MTVHPVAVTSPRMPTLPWRRAHTSVYTHTKLGWACGRLPTCSGPAGQLCRRSPTVGDPPSTSPRVVTTAPCVGTFSVVAFVVSTSWATVDSGQRVALAASADIRALNVGIDRNSKRSGAAVTLSQTRTECNACAVVVAGAGAHSENPRTGTAKHGSSGESHLARPSNTVCMYTRNNCKHSMRQAPQRLRPHAATTYAPP